MRYTVGDIRQHLQEKRKGVVFSLQAIQRPFLQTHMEYVVTNMLIEHCIVNSGDCFETGNGTKSDPQKPETEQISSAENDPLKALLAQEITPKRIEVFMHSQGEYWDGDCWTCNDSNTIQEEEQTPYIDRREQAQTRDLDPTVKRYAGVQANDPEEPAYTFDGRPVQEVTTIPENPVDHGPDRLPIPSEKERDERYEKEGLVWTATGWIQETELLLELLSDLENTPQEEQALIDKACTGNLEASDLFGPSIKHGPTSFLANESCTTPKAGNLKD